MEFSITDVGSIISFGFGSGFLRGNESRTIDPGLQEAGSARLRANPLRVALLEARMFSIIIA